MVHVYPYDDAEELRRVRYAVSAELERKHALGLPVARCDPHTGRVYIQYADGSSTTYCHTKKSKYVSNSK